MVPFGVDKTLDKIKMLEARTSSTRKAVQSAFTRAMQHLSLVQDFSDDDWTSLIQGLSSPYLPTITPIFLAGHVYGEPKWAPSLGPFIRNRMSFFKDDNERIVTDVL